MLQVRHYPADMRVCMCVYVRVCSVRLAVYSARRPTRSFPPRFILSPAAVPAMFFMATCQICANPQDEDAMLPVALPPSCFVLFSTQLYSSLSAFPFFPSLLCLFSLCPRNRVLLTNRGSAVLCCKECVCARTALMCG